MITKITLENFKIFTKARFDTKQITIFIGPNGSGKSTVVNALMLMQQLKHNQTLQLSGENIKIDTVDDILNIPNKPMAIGLEGLEKIERKTVSKQLKRVRKMEEVNFSIQAEFLGINLMNLKSYIYSEKFYLESEFKNRNRISTEQVVELENGRLLVQPNLDIYTPFIVIGSSGIVNENVTRQRTEYLNYISRAPERVIDSLEFIPANRGFSLPGYPIDDRAIDHFQITKQAYDYEKDMATTIAYRRDDLEGRISEWMGEITGIRIKAPLSTGRLVQISAKQAKNRKSKDIKIAYEGFGSNQLLFILIPLAQTKDNSILVIEEPELHLHPKAQAALTRRLLKECGEHSKQLILTTHSEHIIASILTEIADGTLTPDSVAIYYTSRRGQTASKKLLSIDNQGRVKGGLPGFFEANIEEAERHLKALERNK